MPCWIGREIATNPATPCFWVVNETPCCRVSAATTVRLPARAARSVERLTLIWYAYQVDYRDGSEHRGSYLAYDFDCHRGEITRQEWFPSEVSLSEYWGEEPWE